MSKFLNGAHRIYLRVAGGKLRWHQRFFRPSVSLVKTSNEIWFEEGDVLVKAYAAEKLAGYFSGRCNILLAGPSAKAIEDVRLLGEHSLMCVSGSPKILGDHLDLIDIYHVNDVTYMVDRLDDFIKFASHAQWTVIDYRGMYELIRLVGKNLPDTQFVIFDNWAYPHGVPLGDIQRLANPPRHKKVYCSRDLSMGLANAGTVAWL